MHSFFNLRVYFFKNSFWIPIDNTEAQVIVILALTKEIFFCIVGLSPYSQEVLIPLSIGGRPLGVLVHFGYQSP
jgi:hypothetical protein